MRLRATIAALALAALSAVACSSPETAPAPAETAPRRILSACECCYWGHFGSEGALEDWTRRCSREPAPPDCLPPPECLCDGDADGAPDGPNCEPTWCARHCPTPM